MVKETVNDAGNFSGKLQLVELALFRSTKSPPVHHDGTCWNNLGATFSEELPQPFLYVLFSALSAPEIANVPEPNFRLGHLGKGFHERIFKLYTGSYYLGENRLF